MSLYLPNLKKKISENYLKTEQTTELNNSTKKRSTENTKATLNKQIFLRKQS